MPKALIEVYGCQMNAAEAERMAGELNRIGFAPTTTRQEADIIILHTCCVRESAEEKIYGKLGELKSVKRDNPAVILGITGCMAQKEAEALIKRAPHLDFVLGTGQLDELSRTVTELSNERRRIIRTGLDVRPTVPPAEPIRQSKISAWVPIMYGCDNFCSYCIVPYVRGRERSRLPQEILSEVCAAVTDGYQEVTLLGQNVNSYGKNLGDADFADLLREVDRIDGVKRVRFMTSHPKDTGEKLLEVMADGQNICPHIHLPVQHGSDRILRAMNRGYTAEKYLALTETIRRYLPHVALTTDIIVGFPGETEEDFRATLDLVKAVQFDAAFTFLYSPRSGTPAAKMPEQIDADIKKRRLTELMDMQNVIGLAKNTAYEGRKVEVLVEGASKNDPAVWTGRTVTGKIVLWPHQEERLGDIVTVRIDKGQTWVLKGEMMSLIK